MQNSGQGYDQAYNFGGSVQSVRISEVPEPGVWMLMIMGLGTMGAALRRRAATA